jgi:acyl-CoA thioesterase I
MVFVGWSLASLAQASTTPTLLILGDSLSAGYGITLEKGWTSLLQERLKASSKEGLQTIRVLNASISGETTSGGKNRLPTLLNEYKPQWLVIELGANDALRGQDLRTSQKNLASMVEMAQQQGAKVMLLGIRLPTNYGPAYDRQLQTVYSKLAKQYQLIFDPFFLEEVALDPDLMQADALHPNEAAQPIILERLWPKLQNLLQ